jgi:hypothetical protein
MASWLGGQQVYYGSEAHPTFMPGYYDGTDAVGDDVCHVARNWENVENIACLLYLIERHTPKRIGTESVFRPPMWRAPSTN